MRRILLPLVLLIPSLAIAGCGEFGQKYDGGGDDSKAAVKSEKRVSDERFDDEVRERDGCSKIEEVESKGSTHTTSIDEKVTYTQNPPTSGDHYEIAADWGLYDTEQPDVQTVHNLEHGHIVMQYKGLSDAERDKLYDSAKGQFHVLVEPRKENPKDGVYYSAWTAQIHCDRPSNAALQYMIDNWRDQGPELFTDDPGDSMGIKQKQ